MSRLFRCSLSTLFFFFLVFYLKDTSVKPKAANIKNNPSSKCDLDFPIKKPTFISFYRSIFFLNVVLRKCRLYFLCQGLALFCSIVNGKCGLAEKNIGQRLSEDNYFFPSVCFTVTCFVYS